MKLLVRACCDHLLFLLARCRHLRLPPLRSNRLCSLLLFWAPPYSAMAHGYINAYPLPRMPALPILIHLPANAAPSQRACRAVPMLLLTWSSEEQKESAPTDSPLPTPPPASTAAAPPPRRKPKQTRTAVATRNSSRLAAKEDGKFVSATDKATQLKALQNSLALCSKPVQQHVAKKKLLTKTKTNIDTEDLLKLASAVGLGDATCRALDKVLAIGAEATPVLDQVLNNKDV